MESNFDNFYMYSKVLIVNFSGIFLTSICVGLV